MCVGGAGPRVGGAADAAGPGEGGPHPQRDQDQDRAQGRPQASHSPGSFVNKSDPGAAFCLFGSGS